ncbi:hypothetical protein M0R45_007163 [Rubus argutus]|uniref:Glabrous enhancer-binding protein-like DBD domain-containing protein n=1 Tax=Rubus argutus TaxID=59490 RepID=A0AAW1YUJ7_RUBAR
MASSSLQEYQLDSSSVATVEGSSSEASLMKETTTNTNTKQQQQNKKNISIPNPLVPTPTADDDDASKAANPKRVRAENGSVVHVSSKKKKSSAPTLTLQVVDVKKKTAVNSKPPLSAGRIWSEEDEIVILEGYLSYMEDKMKYNDKAKYNTKEFYIYIKDRLSHAGYWTQLRDKVKHLHDKWRTQFAASKNSSIELKTPHDTMVYNLSTKAWRDSFGKKKLRRVILKMAVMVMSRRRVKIKLKLRFWGAPGACSDVRRPEIASGPENEACHRKGEHRSVEATALSLGGALMRERFWGAPGACSDVRRPEIASGPENEACHRKGEHRSVEATALSLGGALMRERFWGAPGACSDVRRPEIASGPENEACHRKGEHRSVEATALSLGGALMRENAFSGFHHFLPKENLAVCYIDERGVYFLKVQYSIKN